MKHKLFTLFVVLISATALFAYDCKIDGIYYNLNEGTMTATITKETGNDETKYYSNSTINIPSTIIYKSLTYSVTTIGFDAFRDCSSLTSVTIPNSVTTIERGAFWGCTSLTSATIPNSVTTIGNRAFSNCSSLTLIIIPNSVTTIEGWAFSWCKGLTSVIIQNPNVKIDEGVFHKCAITDLYCGSSVDLSLAKGTIKNVHRLSEDEFQYVLPFDQYAKGFVESQINEWQKKGVLERTSDWQVRVTETTRKQKVNEYVKEAEKKYLAGYAKRQNYKFTVEKYDPDNEVFLVKEDQRGDFLVPVPVADAEYVETNWSSCTSTPHYAFSGTDIVLQSVDFTFPNKKTYTYKPNQQLTYSTPDIKYNFNPIELPDLQTVTMGGVAQVTQTPQGITEVIVTTPFDLTPMSSVLVSYKNIFGKYEMPDLDVTFPYIVIRVKLTGTPNLIRLAKQSLSLDLGQSYIVEQTVPQDDKILFLVPTGVRNIYLTDGNGQRQLLYSGRLQPNTIYDGTVEVK